MTVEHDAMVTARVNGYSWQEIHAYGAEKRQEAVNAGYSPEEIGHYLGRDVSGTWLDGVRNAERMRLIEEEKNDRRAATPTE